MGYKFNVDEIVTSQSNDPSKTETTITPFLREDSFFRFTLLAANNL